MPTLTLNELSNVAVSGAVDGEVLTYEDGAWIPDTPAAGGSPPTGTGFRHVTAGAEDAAAKLVENADVHASAAIVESKLSLNNPTHANTNDPTAGEKAALPGTSGAPGSGNKYVTDADARNTNARTPTAHTHPKSEVDDTGLWGAAELGTGTPSGAKYLRDDQVWTVPPAGGSPPTGTGFTHITAGSQDAAAKLVDTADVNNDQITYAKIQNISATQRALGRNTVGAGDTEEVTASQLMDWIGSTRGAVLIRGAAGWIELAPGASGTVVKSNGPGADPTYQTDLTGAGSDPVLGLYAPGSFTIPTGKYAIMAKRFEGTGSQRITGQGTGQLRGV